MRKLLNATQAAEILGISEYRVYAFARQGILPTVRIGTKLVRFDEQQLQKWIEAGGSTRTSDDQQAVN